MPNLPVKNYLSTDTGVPPLQGTVGAGIAWADGLFIDGYNLKSLTSLTQSGGVATADTATAHGYRLYQVIQIAGASQSGWNTQAMVTEVTSTTRFKFAVDSALAATATGTLTCKVAPLGWSKVFSGTNKAVYRSNDLASNRLYWRFDDTNALYMLFRGYESMTDVDTGIGVFPTVTQQSNWCYTKSSTSDTTARRWSAYGDSMTLYFLLAHNVAAGAALPASGFPPILGFGDSIPFKAGDAYSSFCFARASLAGAINTDVGINASGSIGPYWPRPYTQSGSSIRGQIYGAGPNTASGSSGSAIAYPNPEDNGLIIFERHLAQDGNNDFRGIFPAGYHLPQNNPLSDWDYVSNVDGFSGKIFQMVACGGGGSTSNDGRMAIDITGPWR